MKKKTVTIIYNTCSYVLKFRLPLIAALKAAGYNVVVVAPSDETSSRLARHDVTHRPISMSQYGMNPLSELRSIREIREILKEIGPVATLNYTIKPNTFGTIAAHQAGVPVLNNIAGSGKAFSEGNPIMRSLVVALYRRSLRHSHTVFFQNSDDMELFRTARLVREDQCVRIPGSGVDLSRFRPSPVPHKPMRFLFVGRLLKQKGVSEFLEAANALLADAPDPSALRFDLVGELEDSRGYIPAEDLRRMTQAPQISYLGVVAPERIDTLMREASVVVLPSYYGEGVPRVLLEACAAGRPIITTDNVGCRDVVEPGHNGWQVPPRDAVALKEAMQSSILAGPDELSRLGAGARQTSEDRFDEALVINAYLERLEGLSQAARPPS